MAHRLLRLFLSRPGFLRPSRRRFSASPLPPPKGSGYQVLGVPFGASEEQIRQAYLDLAKVWHPDVSQDPESETVFRRVTQAYRDLLALTPKAGGRRSAEGRGGGGSTGFAASSSDAEPKRQFKRTQQETERLKQARSWTDEFRAQHQARQGGRKSRETKAELDMLRLSVTPIDRFSTYELRCMAQRLGIAAEGRRSSLVSELKQRFAVHERKKAGVFKGAVEGEVEEQRSTQRRTRSGSSRHSGASIWENIVKR